MGWIEDCEQKIFFGLMALPKMALFRGTFALLMRWRFWLAVVSSIVDNRFNLAA